MANRLIGSTSPYLLQHAHNPVDWHPWGEEALARARDEDRPILLSIGYSACHWCHVMERESFEDEAIAALMNRDFVCIKVDREERPDLDDVYMAATLAMNQGQGGWPMTVFLTPEQQPFFAGTYFPPEDRWGRPGFRSLLERIAELWRSDRERLRGQASEVVAYLRQNAGTAPGAEPDVEQLRLASAEYRRAFDERSGGFGGAPKFPAATGLMLLLRCHARFGDERALEMVRKTLDEMARGGIYDQVGGGFHRYSVDASWLVPHFEKMLYDNALLARAYLEGYQATGDPFYRRIASEVLDYVLREMTSPEGGFFSATDADSEGEEGKFFVWTPAEVEAVLGADDARVFCAYFDITDRGNWEGHSIPNTTRSGPRVAASLGLAPEVLDRRIAALRPRLYAARRERVAPGLDDKVLTAWNGLMIGAFAEGHRVLGEPRYLAAARRAADFVSGALRDGQGRLLRSYRAGQAHVPAFLEDYAFLAEGLIELYEAGAPASVLRQALELAEVVRRDFAGDSGAFDSTGREHESLIVRHREGHDGAIPSANAAAAHVLGRLGFHFDRPDLRDDARRALRAYAAAVARQPRGFAKSLIAADLLLDGPLELAFVGSAGSEDLAGLVREVARHYLPNRIVAHQHPEAPDIGLPLLEGKTAIRGRAALYVCRNFTCQQPVTDAVEVAAALAAARGEPPAGGRRSTRQQGAATAEATAAHAARWRGAGLSDGYGPLGETGLTVSRIGFGGYRVDDDTPEHREALRQALRSGCNLIDTSTNYTDGASERLVGEVLAEPAGDTGVRREQIVVVSKIGYVQGRNLELAQEREAEGRAFPEMVKYGDGIWHCIHPEFLEDQLSRSLDRLGLACLDVCLLHNPEYFLKDEHERSHGKLDGRRAEFDRRIAAAFGYLEAQVAAGRIRFYGVSSNTCTSPADDPEFTSLTAMLEAARRATPGPSHFRVLQLPLNLLESGAVLTRNNGPELSQSVLELAEMEGIAVLVNRPLNAFAGGGLLRLADAAAVEPSLDLESQLARVAELEAEYRREIAPHLRSAEGSPTPESLFRFADELPGLLQRLSGLEHWDELERHRIRPRLLQVLQALDQALAGPLATTWHDWRERYLPELHALLSVGRSCAAAISRRATAPLRAVLRERMPDARRGESLSRQALWVAASTPGVSGVLVGMRRPEYVDDALGILAWPRLADAASVYQAVAGSSRA